LLTKSIRIIKAYSYSAGLVTWPYLNYKSNLASLHFFNSIIEYTLKNKNTKKIMPSLWSLLIIKYFTTPISKIKTYITENPSYIERKILSKAVLNITRNVK